MKCEKTQSCYEILTKNSAKRRTSGAKKNNETTRGQWSISTSGIIFWAGERFLYISVTFIRACRFLKSMVLSSEFTERWAGTLDVGMTDFFNVQG